MKNLIMSAACGLQPSQIEFFLKSLRKYYEEEVFFLVGKKDIETKNFLKKYNCNFLEVSVHKFDIQLKRYSFFLEILKKKEYKNILFCDSRDIYFQANPFKYPYKGSINYFLEDKKIKDCPYNSDWIIKTYGKKIYDTISNNVISCGGTILGTQESIKKFLELMKKEISTHKFQRRLKYVLTFRRDKGARGSDQSHGNYIAHNNLIKNSFFYSNEGGPIATAFHLKKIKFNENYELMNIHNEPYAVVHQYDKKWDEFKDAVSEFKKRLGIK
ncbi:hypothetical protein OAM08_00340 [Pelagibacteraceae bacterium]|nr:hypothetical protein [Pelagibacteraceae bacterium]